MAPSSRMTLASLLQPDSEEPRRPSAPAQPLPPPASYPPEQYTQPSHSQSQPSNYSQNYSGSSQYPYPTSQPAHTSQHHTQSYHPPGYTPSPAPSQPHHHSYHAHSHHHHSHPSLHPHPVAQGHSHLPNHPHPGHHQHTHHTHPHSHSHHSHPHHSLPHPHSHVHVIHSHPPAAPTNPPPPPSSSSAAGSPPYSSSHAFSGTGSTRGSQPIIPITPAPRSPVAPFAGASRSPSAPYPIYGAGAALASGRRSPMPAEYSSSQPHGASSSSGSRRNTLTGPQAIEPVILRDYPNYPAGSNKHPDEAYPPPPAFSAPVYGPRPESPQTQTTGGNKSRRSGGGTSSSTNRTARSASTKRSIGGASEAKRASDRSRERDSERELDKEREEHLYREREREKEREREREERAREREYDERAARDRERERDRQAQHELEMRDRRAPAPSKRLENEFARRPPTANEWDRFRDRGRVPREQERDWRREEEERQALASKHLPPISHGPMPGYSDSSKQHMHSHNISMQQPRHMHLYPHQPASPPPPALPPILSPVWLGTHVYPNLPFPLCLPPTLSRNNLTPEGYKPYQYTILVPCGFLPLQPATRSPRPAIPLWGSPDTGYTDDSNLILAAVHCGKSSWSEIRQARKLKQDAKIVVGVWVGGANGGRNAKRPKGGAWEGRPGSGQLHSSSWGNSHDGGGMEIVEITWIEKGAAHAPHRPNRRERMEQYAKRRADLDLVPPVKRDRIDTWYLDSDDEELSIPAKRTWDVGDTIVFGKGGTTSGFVYDPHALRSVVFEESNERSTKRLKSNAVSSDVRRDIVLENDDEQYILTLNSDDKRTYTLSTLSPKSKKTEVLRKSLTEEDVAFFDKGLCVWLKGDDPKDLQQDKEDEPMDADRKGWFCRVNRWKFAPDATTVDA